MPPTFVLLLICLFGGIYADDPTTKELTITKINLDPLPTVFFTLGAVEEAPDATFFFLTVQTVNNPSEDKEYEMEGTFTADNNCGGDLGASLNCKVSFKPEFVENKDEPLIIVLTGEYTTPLTKENIIVRGIERVTLAEIPQIITAHSVGIALRIKEDLQGWSVYDTETETEVPREYCDTDNPCYTIYEEEGDIPTSLAVCAVTDVTEKLVIVKSFSAEALGTDAADPTSITLDYGNTPSIGLIIAGTTGPNCEAVIYKDPGTIASICWDASNPCMSEPAYTQSDEKFSIILIDVGGDGIPINSKTKEFKDINLNVFALDETVLEARWTHTVNKYTAERNKISGDADGDPAFTTVNVDCSSSHLFCHAYYVNVAKNGVYTVTITPNMLLPQGPNVLNIITSAPANMHAIRTPRGSKNSIKNMTIENQYTQSSGNLEINICVSHNSTINLDGTQLEVVLISDNNQWKRIIKGSLHQVEQRSCYSTIFVLKPDKDSHSSATALVIQRDVSTNEVISFYRSDFNLPAVLAIKPEVDNGSEGSTSTLAIVGAAIGGIAFLMALVAAAVMFVMKIKRDNDGLQYPLHRTNIEQDSSYIHGLDNPIPTM